MTSVMATMMLRLMAIAMVIGSICASPIVSISDKSVHTHGTSATHTHSFVTGLASSVHGLSSLVSPTHPTIVKTSSEGPLATGIHAGERPNITESELDSIIASIKSKFPQLAPLSFKPSVTGSSLAVLPTSAIKPHHGPIIENGPNKVIRAEEFARPTDVSTGLTLPSGFPTGFVFPTNFPTHLILPTKSHSSIERSSVSASGFSMPTELAPKFTGFPAFSVPKDFPTSLISDMFPTKKQTSIEHSSVSRSSIPRPTVRPSNIERVEDFTRPISTHTLSSVSLSSKQTHVVHGVESGIPSTHWTAKSRPTGKPTHVVRGVDGFDTQIFKSTHTLSSVKHTGIPTSISHSSFTRPTERPSHVARGDELVKSVSHSIAIHTKSSGHSSIVSPTASITGAGARPTFLKGPDGTLFNVTDEKQFSSFFDAWKTAKYASDTPTTRGPKPTGASQKRDLSEEFIEELLRTKSSLNAQWAKGSTLSPEQVSSFLATQTYKSGLPTIYSIPTEAPSFFKREDHPSLTLSSASRPTGVTHTSISHSAPTGTHTLTSHRPSGTHTAIAPTDSVVSKCKIPGACDTDFCGTCLYVDADGKTAYDKDCHYVQMGLKADPCT